eukprot:TRINITY_DN69806_c0_g1_i1.p1 TRINITY_DN69806_c0_g1~~TRINITY_DN69806_c0_g1_i1.p1  ORF type:complete len:293 (+),score=35.07 TRINITY_DN69806_c0_g1_i1:99-881(+)
MPSGDDGGHRPCEATVSCDSDMKAKAEARRRRLLAQGAQRLARLGPGLEQECSDAAQCRPVVAVEDKVGEANTSAATETGAAETPTVRSGGVGGSPTRPAERQHEEDVAAAWLHTLRVRRWERGYRFFGNALLASLFGLFSAGSRIPPPLVVFLVLELTVAAIAWHATSARRARRCANSERAEGSADEDFIEQLFASVTCGSSAGTTAWLPYIDTSLRIGSACVDLMQDGAWFLFVLVATRCAREDLATIFDRRIPPIFS